MSSIAVTASATGTGTVTLLAPATSTNQTLTLPDATGTVLSTATAGVPINGPAFSAYQSTAQAFTGGVAIKVQYQTKEFDTNSNFDNTTTYRFTPTVSGYFIVSAGLAMASSPVGSQLFIFKNGTQYKVIFNNITTSATNGAYGSALVFFNGSTDYVEVYGAFATSQNSNTGISATYFQAAMIRSAT